MSLKPAFSHTFLWIFLAAALLRLGLIAYSVHHDARHALKYTDIDYKVFTDATSYLVSPDGRLGNNSSGPLARRSGLDSLVGDPYVRDTYRYTPLLAILLIPNVLVHPTFGKILFALSDLLVGGLLYSMLVRRGSTPAKASLYVGALWLLNPMVANISTRGSSEALLGVMVVSTLALAERGRWDACAVVFGLAVHFKIYPVIYAASLLAKLHVRGSRWWPFNAAQIRLGCISFAAFMLLNLVMYSMCVVLHFRRSEGDMIVDDASSWGYPFLHHTYLYHLHRLDHRHNFSPYFYPIYLAYPTPSSTAPPPNHSILRHPLTSFAPQLVLSILLGVFLGKRDISLAWFAQTVAFVAFNKVCTSQVSYHSLVFSSSDMAESR
jgi:phosphatidylinositol glycan class M